MKNTFATWKYALIGAVLFLGTLWALPNIFGKSPAVQIQLAEPTHAENILKINWAEANLTPPKRFQQNKNILNLYFDQTDEQIKAKEFLEKRFPETPIAINLLSNNPAFLEALGFAPMNLGLDLRGGVSFLLQVDNQELFTRKNNELLEETTAVLQKNNLVAKSMKNGTGISVELAFETENQRDEALNALFSGLAPDMERQTVDNQGLIVRYSENAINELKRRAAEQNRIRMSGRVNSLGVAEPSIQVVGNDRILVQLPGIQDVNKAKELLGSTATLEFYIVDENANIAEAVRMGRGKLNQKLAYFEDKTPIVLKRKVVMSGEHITDAGVSQGQSGIQVDVRLDTAGGAKMLEVTRENIKKPMATVFVEFIPVTKKGADGKDVTVVEKRETVVNSATIQGLFSNQFQITGVYPLSRAEKLAATLRAGSLVAPVYIIEERTIGPSAGQKNINQGLSASILGLVLVALFMAVYYKKLGWYSVIALAFNLVLLIGLMSLIGATLTLPGIAGIVLTMGMAVDANVLIYERIREELNGKLPTIEAIRLGFGNALSTIVDANITTLIVAIMLFSFGAGPIKGFAVTLSIGILTTMFSAIYVTRALVEWFIVRPEKTLNL